jgi:hypothetical protein
MLLVPANDNLNPKAFKGPEWLALGFTILTTITAAIVGF